MDFIELIRKADVNILIHMIYGMFGSVFLVAGVWLTCILFFISLGEAHEAKKNGSVFSIKAYLLSFFIGFGFAVFGFIMLLWGSNV